jgi:hypothetical protein
MWVGLVGDPAVGGTLLAAEDAGEVVGFIHFGPASGNDEIGEVMAFMCFRPRGGQRVRRHLWIGRSSHWLSRSLWRFCGLTQRPIGPGGSTPSLVGQRPETTAKRPPGMVLLSPLSNTGECSYRSELWTYTRRRDAGPTVTRTQPSPARLVFCDSKSTPGISIEARQGSAIDALDGCRPRSPLSRVLHPDPGCASMLRTQTECRP